MLRLTPPMPALPRQRLEVVGVNFGKRSRVRVIIEATSGFRSRFNASSDGTFEVGVNAPKAPGLYTLKAQRWRKGEWVDHAEAQFRVE